MKILVTGGCGFIGHNVVMMLEALGHDVVIIDNHTDYGFLPKTELEYLYAERRKKYQAMVYLSDIVNGTDVDYVVNHVRPTIIIHLASFPRQKAVAVNPGYAAKVMCGGLTNLLEAADRNHAEKFVYISSSMVYGDFPSDVRESAHCHPRGQYGIFKYMGEKLVQDYSSRTGLFYTTIRPSAVYGELDVEDRVVSKFLLGAHRGEIIAVNGHEEVLDFTHVEDVARGIVQATLSQSSHQQTYNLTRAEKEKHTLLDAATMSVDLAGRGTVRIAPRDMSFPKRGRLSITNAMHDFGYAPKIDLADGLARYYDWIKTCPYYDKKLRS
jgi:nucleoside-diphosphate-sugar epimerase